MGWSFLGALAVIVIVNIAYVIHGQILKIKRKKYLKKAKSVKIFKRRQTLNIDRQFDRRLSKLHSNEQNSENPFGRSIFDDSSDESEGEYREKSSKKVIRKQKKLIKEIPLSVIEEEKEFELDLSRID